MIVISWQQNIPNGYYNGGVDQYDTINEGEAIIKCIEKHRTNEYFMIEGTYYEDNRNQDTE